MKTNLIDFKGWSSDEIAIFPGQTLKANERAVNCIAVLFFDHEQGDPKTETNSNEVTGQEGYKFARFFRRTLPAKPIEQKGSAQIADLIEKFRLETESTLDPEATKARQDSELKKIILKQVHAKLSHKTEIWAALNRLGARYFSELEPSEYFNFLGFLESLEN